MNDLEATRLCAEAMGLTIHPDGMVALRPNNEWAWTYFRPLNDDAQAMALVKRFDLHIGKTLRTPEHPRGQWYVSRTDKHEASGPDLNNCIVYTVAAMQQGKGRG